MFYCREGAEEFSPGLQPISARIMRGASMGAWFLSRRDSTIVARHEYLFSAPSVVLGLFIPYKSRTMDDDEDE